MEERLQNVLSHAGVASRRRAAEIIAEGRVTVDGVVIKEAGARVDPAAVKIAVDGRPLAAPEPKRTVMLYKPVGVLSSTSDPFGGKTVAELVTTPGRLGPVGRLDKDYNLPNIMMTTYFSYYGEEMTFKEVTFRPRQGGTNSINIKKIIKIGWKALKDFHDLKKAM